VLALVGQVVEQSAVGWVAGGPGHQLVDLRAETVCRSGEGDGVHGAGVVGVAEGERVLKDAAHRVRGVGLAPVGVGDQLPAAAQQVRQAALVARVREAAIRRPAVAFQHAGIVLAEHLGGVLVAPPACDTVDGDLVADERPQPCLAPPTRQPVSSGATNGLARTPAVNDW
jgi:hypothetical protein